VPHVPIPGQVPEQEAPAPVPAKSKFPKLPKPALIAAAAVIVLGAGFFAWTMFSPKPPPPAPVAAKKKSAPPAAASAPAAGQPAPLTPSDTANALAKVPVNAINKAQGVVAAREASGQVGVDAVVGSEDLAGKRAVSPTAAAGKTGPAPSRSSTTVTSVSAGVSATTEVDAAPEASPAFRSFVANAKVSGVFQGTPPGETVDGGLGVEFSGLDADKKQLIFKDKAGATVFRKY
jgi:hypothetical protein